MSNANKTYLTYEQRKADGSHDCWVTKISDINTGAVEATYYTTTEEEGRQWGWDYLNGKFTWNTGKTITLPPPSAGKVITIRNGTNTPLTIQSGNVQNYDPLAPDPIQELDQAPVRMYGDFTPPPKPDRPEIEATCYLCGNKFKPVHSWNSWTDNVHLTMAHCGRTEYKELTLQQATEVAKIGYLAFLR
jgi:hypothetical protein